jgi:hypothetical protein
MAEISRRATVRIRFGGAGNYAQQKTPAKAGVLFAL